jgi:hypothetical protein
VTVASGADSPESRDHILLERVRKLLEKSRGTANVHESDAFAAKAAELIARHRLDPDRLAAPASGELAVRDIQLGRGAYVRARLALLMAVADAHDGVVVFASTATGTVAHVAGFVDDLDVIEVVYTSLHSQAAARMAAERRATGAATQRFRRSFLFGYADRMRKLLASSRAAAEAAASEAAGSSDGVIELRARAARVDDFARSTFGRTRAARRPNAAQEHGWRAGERAAESADVGRARLAARPGIGRGAP